MKKYKFNLKRALAVEPLINGIGENICDFQKNPAWYEY